MHSTTGRTATTRAAAMVAAAIAVVVTGAALLVVPARGDVAPTSPRTGTTRIVDPFAPYEKRTLRLGQTNAATRVVQTYLHVRPANGHFGRSTRRAVRAFQRVHRLPRTGRVDRRTWAALRARFSHSVTTPSAGAGNTGSGLPGQLFAPYFQSYRGTDLAAATEASGARYVDIGFLETAGSGSCTLLWRDVGAAEAGSVFTDGIEQVRASGGDVIMSFGGGAGSARLSELADSCTSVDAIAGELERVIGLYDLRRIDFDIEGVALTDRAGVERRNRALAQVVAWAAASHRRLDIQYTLPVATYGLLDDGLALLRSAVRNGVPVAIVNVMTFDYYDGARHEMAQDTISAATAVQKQLRALWPKKTDAQLWAMIGVTEMPGIDDHGADETFTLADAATVRRWASDRHLGLLSFWALQRDNGGCPGAVGSDTCSGVSQGPYAFAHAFSGFTAS